MFDYPFNKFGMKKTIIFISFFALLLVHSAKSQPCSEAQILFISNINGVLENCNCGNPSLGGLDRIAGIVKELRKMNPGIIYVDGGDLFNSYSFPRLNRAIIEAYEVIEPDIVAPGDQEFVEGYSFFKKNMKPFWKNLLTSNIQLGAETVTSKIKSYKIGDRKIIFLSFLDVYAFGFVPLDKNLSFQNNTFTELYRKINEKDFLFVIYHGPENRLKKFIKKYPNIDCVLLGHQQRIAYSLEGKPAIISGGEDGAYLMNIKLLNRNKNYRIELEKIAIYDSLKKDSSVQKVIKSFKNYSKEKGGGDRRK